VVGKLDGKKVAGGGFLPAFAAGRGIGSLAIYFAPLGLTWLLFSLPRAAPWANEGRRFAAARF
jgi:hypothetical protein